MKKILLSIIFIFALFPSVSALAAVTAVDTPVTVFHDYGSAGTVNNYYVRGTGTAQKITMYNNNKAAVFRASNVPLNNSTKYMYDATSNSVRYVEIILAPGSTLTELQTSRGRVFEFSNGEVLPTSNPEPNKFVINNLKFLPDNGGTGTLTWDGINSQYFKEYRIYQESTFLQAVTETTFPISGMKPGDGRVWKVTVVDTFGREFAGNTVSYTMPLPDTTPPPVPVLSGSAGNLSAVLNWTQVNAVDFAEYRLYQDGVMIKKITTNSTTITGLAKKMYTYEVSAVDSSGNESARSNKVQITPKDAPPPVTENDQQATDDFLLVTWKATPNAVKYEIYLNNRLIATVGNDVLSYKITRDMGYRPGGISNKTDVRAVFADGTKGESGNDQPSAPANLGALSVKNMLQVAMAFLSIYGSWVLLALAVVFVFVFIGPIIDLVDAARKKGIFQMKGR